MVSPADELMLIFTSGRIIALPVAALPLIQNSGSAIPWAEAFVAEEPNLGETLACVVPVSRLALADYFLQVSRRGYAKKIRTSLGPTIMGNKYIGTGIKVPADQTMTLIMGQEGDHFALVSYEGYLQVIPEEMLPYAIVEAMRLGRSDHLVAAFTTQWAHVLVMTQVGKVIQRTVESLEAASDLARKGRMLYSTARREAGVRVVGAAAVEQEDWAVALHSEGEITLHAVCDLIGKGVIDIRGELLDFQAFQGSQAEA
jgi:DNA gyrase/topoisomerase IV subunit A